MSKYKIKNIRYIYYIEYKKINNCDFSNVVGDFHESIPLIYKDGSTREDFFDSADNLLSLLKKGNLLQAAFEKTNNFKDRSIFKNNQNVKADFVGYLLDEQIDNIYSSVFGLEMAHNDWLDDGRIRVTLFIYSGRIFCIWQNHPKGLIENLRNNGIKTVILR